MKLSVLVPSSLVREAEDQREATRKLGYVARAAAVFRANELVVFPDEDGENNWGGEFVETVLRYAATPPTSAKRSGASATNSATLVSCRPFSSRLRPRTTPTSRPRCEKES